MRVQVLLEEKLTQRINVLFVRRASLSVTLVTPDGSLGDGLAVAFMIAGLDESVRLLAKMENAPGVVFIREKDGEPEVLATENLKDSVLRSVHPVRFIGASTGSSGGEAPSGR